MTVFDDIWKRLPIPGEYDSMDATDQGLWRSVVATAIQLERDACKFLAESYAASCESEEHPYGADAATDIAENIAERSK